MRSFYVLFSCAFLCALSLYSLFLCALFMCSFHVLFYALSLCIRSFYALFLCALFMCFFMRSFNVLFLCSLFMCSFYALFVCALFMFIIYFIKNFIYRWYIKIAFANKFQPYHKIQYNIYYISLLIKHPQSISPIFLILFLNSNNELLDFTTAGKLFHIKEPRKRIAFVP